ncbi:MAG: hypothetical protein PHU25_15515 [Deltaproteobacteria bacterium]|nr:hypothetical protein [Deltaproteobacteria bacterium]
MTREICIGTVLLALAGCAGAAVPLSSRTLPGVTGQQAIGAARIALVGRGYRIESLEPGRGALTTGWRDRNRRSMRYEVQVEGAGGSEDVTVAVAAKARDRIVGGWSSEYAAPWAATDLIDEIERATTGSALPAVGVPPEPAPQAAPVIPAAPPVPAAPPAHAPAADAGPAQEVAP